MPVMGWVMAGVNGTGVVRRLAEWWVCAGWERSGSWDWERA